MDLVEKGVKRIFYPCMPYNMEDDVNRTGNHYNCPVVASYAENIRNNMDVLRNENIEFIEPSFPSTIRKRCCSVSRKWNSLRATASLPKN